MEEQLTPGHITKTSLREFFNNPGAPEGFAYFLGDKPLAQVQFFPKVYSLYWLGTVDPQLLGEKFVAALKSIDLKAIGTPLPEFKGKAAIAVNIDSRRDGQIKRLEKELILPSGEPAAKLTEELTEIQKTAGDYPQITSADFELKSVAPEIFLSFFGDTDHSPNQEKTTGITANLPLNAPMEDLLKEDCVGQKLNPQVAEELIDAVKADILTRHYTPSGPTQKEPQ